jgi:hypothetical protein
LKVNRWWTGGYQAQGGGGAGQDAVVQPASFNPDAPKNDGLYGIRLGDKGFIGVVARGKRAPASDQLASAQSRAKAARERAQARMSGRGRKGSDFHVFNGGVVGAVALFMIAILGAAALMLAVRGRNLRIVRSTGPTGQTFVSIDLPGMDGVFVPPPTPAQGAHPVPPIPPRFAVVNPNRPAPRVVVNGHSEADYFDQLPLVSVKGHRVLIVSDIQPMTPSVTGTLERLESAGFTLLGNLPGAHQDEDVRAEQEELEASVKMVRGLGQLDSPDVSSHLSHWIAEQDGLNLLVWFARSEDQARERCYIFAPALDSDSSAADIGTRESDLTAAQTMIAGNR